MTMMSGIDPSSSVNPEYSSIENKIKALKIYHNVLMR